MAKRKRISTEIISGVYAIINMVNNKVYIGSSKDIYGRWVQHRYKLDNNIHHSKYLQNAWNKYGKDNFEFKIIEVIDEKLLFECEQKWYDYYNSIGAKNTYNMSDIARCPSYRATIDSLNEGKQCITMDQFNKIINYLCNTDISIPRIAKKLNAPKRTIYQIYFKKQYSILTENYEFIQRKNIGETASASILTEEKVMEIIKKLLNNEFSVDIASEYEVSATTIDDIYYHKTWTHLTENIDFPNHSIDRYRPLTKPVSQYDLDGNYINTYESAREAEKQTGIGYKMISRVCNGGRPYTHGYIFKFAI
jgi:group I intron endonuclease